MDATIQLPRVSIGGYRAVLGHCTDEEVAARFMRHTERANQLKRELAAEILRSEVAFAEFQARSAS